MEIRYLIKEIRDEYGLSQAELSERLEVAQTTVSHWELGLKTPGYANLKKICTEFDLPAELVLGLSPENSVIAAENNNVVAEINSEMKKLKTSEKYQVLGYIDALLHMGR